MSRYRIFLARGTSLSYLNGGGSQPALTRKLHRSCERCQQSDRNYVWLQLFLSPLGEKEPILNASVQMNPDDADMEGLSAAFAEQNVHQLPTSMIMGMTQEERLHALDVIHGVVDVPEEHPDVVQAKLVEMDEILTQLDPTHRGAFDEAVRRNLTYVQQCRLPFLRAFAFDAAKAAQRMAAHFKTRLALFETVEVLGRDIKLSDLSRWNEDLPLIETGALQLLKHPDSAGRSIILICAGKFPYAPYHFPSLGRVLLMLGVMGARSLSSVAQRRGLIVLWVGHGAKMHHPPNSNVSQDNGFQYLSLFSVFPIQIRVVHVCHDDARFIQLWNRMVAVIKPHQAVRFKSHLGSLPACLQSLRQYGIPQEILPLDEHANLCVSDFRKSLLCHETELDSGGRGDHLNAESPARQTTIHIPTDNDIRLGKGKRSHRFRGNQLFRLAIAENYDAYNSSINRREKATILHLVYFHLIQSGCRFLIPVQNDGIGDPTEWMEISEEQALEKIAMRMRNSRRQSGTSGR